MSKHESRESNTAKLEIKLYTLRCFLQEPSVGVSEPSSESGLSVGTYFNRIDTFTPAVKGVAPSLSLSGSAFYWSDFLQS